MTQHYDAIVIGTGSAGQTAGEMLSSAGKRVAAFEKRAIGGTCALRGCEPKKVLYAAAEVAERAAGQAGNGIAGQVRVDWPALIAYKRTFTGPVPEKVAGWLRDSGITVIEAAARFVAPDTLEASGMRYTAEAFIIATGAVPMDLGIPGGELVTDSEAFMELDALPQRVVFIGGGYVSFEFAHVAAAAGATVTVLHRGAHVLEPFDPDLTARLADAYRRQGIEVRTGAAVAGVRRAGGALEVVLADGTALPCDLAVHGAGRVPELADLGLEAAGVVWGRGGVKVDARLRAEGNDRVFAIGDAAALGAPLTPVAIAQARVAARVILGDDAAAFDPAVTPSVVFSAPQLASVGITEAGAIERGVEADVTRTESSDWASTRRVGGTVSAAKVIAERGTGRLLGAHLLGPGAGEVINVFALAIARRMTRDELRSTLWAYPTAGSDVVYLV